MRVELPTERSRCVPVTSRQSRGRLGADRTDKVLRQTSQSSSSVNTRPEEKIRIVLEGFRREVTVNDLCRREGIKPHSYYSWTKEFMETGKEKLTHDSVRDAIRQGI